MDIGIVHPELIYPRGAEKQVCKLSYYLNKMGHDVTIYTFEKKENCVFNSLLENIEIISLNEKWISGPFYSYNLVRWQGLIKKLSKKIKEHDILNAHNHPAQWISKYTDIPTVWTCNEPYQHNISSYIKKMYSVHSLIDRKLTRSTKLILSLSNRIKELIKMRYPDKKVNISYSGADLDHEVKHINNDYFDAIFVGPIQPQKHPFDIIKAFSLIDGNIENVRLHFVGNTTSFVSKKMKNEMIKYAAKNDIETLFYGSIPNDKLYELYNIADISLFVPEAEPWGIFPLETILGGIPTIISDQCGIKDILPDDNPVVETGNITQLADKIMEIKNNYHKYKHRTVKTSKMVSKKYSWEAYSRRMENILKQSS
ncbi:glycosyltransferase family 4 protein [Methanobacterium sp. MBAC-LM]|uniref:glycosyltransferase family 4 protein n=1 Tax=Methanobacterium sp. MBAC-LM TaxID=3412034 RepID=UPI003C76BC10